MMECYARCDWSLSMIYKSTGTEYRNGKFLFFVWFNMARDFENFYEIILDLSKWKPRKKKLSRSYLRRKKREKRRQNLEELFTTWEQIKKEMTKIAWKKTFRQSQI